LGLVAWDVRHVWAVDESESIATIRRRLILGINLLDTGDFYGMGHNGDADSRAMKAAAGRLHFR